MSELDKETLIEFMLVAESRRDQRWKPSLHHTQAPWYLHFEITTAQSENEDKDDDDDDVDML